MQHQLLAPQQLVAQPAAGRANTRTLAPLRAAPTPRRILCVGQSAGAAGTRTAVSVIDDKKLQQPNRRPSTPQLQLVARVCYLPHPLKESYGGEDAHFISESTGAMGVADGVGGWAESGINPAEYSRTLMAVACAHLEGRDLLEAIPERTQTSLAVREFIRNPVPPPLPGVVDPQAAVDVAHRLTRLPGSSTVCLLQLDPYSESLIAANVGDSGFMLVRDGQKALQSRPLEHFFDCPLQLGAFPDFVQATDSAADAELYDIPLQRGDVIVVGTDGLWDNCYDKELLRLIPRSVDEAQASADAMAALARRHASDPDYASPYIQEARQNGFDLPWWEKVLGARVEGGTIKLKDPTGGKQDDITVIVAYVDYLEEALEEVADSEPAAPASSNGTGASSNSSSSNGNGNGSNGNGISNGVATVVVEEVVEEAPTAAAAAAVAAGVSGNGVNGVVVEEAVAAAVTVEEPAAAAAVTVEEEAVTVAAAPAVAAAVVVEEEAVAVAAAPAAPAPAAVVVEEEEAVAAAAAPTAAEAVAVAPVKEAAAAVVVVVDEAAAARLVEVGQAAAGGAAAALVAEVKVAGAVAAAAAAAAMAEELVSGPDAQ